MRVDVQTGTVIAGFRVLSVLGEGAMGVVFLAEETATGRRVALKLLVPELARDERFRRRFLRETELAASLDNPHVVPTIASGEEDGTLYLAMEHVEGSDLRKLLRSEGPLEPVRALALTEQVADALDSAHAKGLVHRDVKPGNILVAETPSGEHAYLCDFGLARHVSSASSLTADRGLVGTIDYVPPEQIESGEVDARADVYSLGCVLYESLAGVRPFERESELSVLFAHLNEPPPSLTEIRPDLPVELDAVFATALAKTPDDRYQTCDELVQAARAGLHGKVLARRGRVRRRALLALGAAAIAVGATVGGILVTRSTQAAAHGGVARRSISLQPSALNMIDARTRRVVGNVGIGTQVPVADTGWNVTFTKHAAWVLVTAKQRLVRVDLRTRKVTGAVVVPWPPGAITTGGGSVWVMQDGGPQILQVDPGSGKVVRQIAVRGGQSEGGAAFGAGSLWLSSGNGVVRADPQDGRIVHRFPVVGTSSMLVAFADGSVFAARQGNGTIAKIDPASNRITYTTALHGWVSDLAAGGGSIWVSIVRDGVVYRLGEDDLSVRQTLPAGSDPERISFGGGALWVADASSGTVSRVAQVSGVREAFSSHDAQPATAAYHGGLVWVGASPPLPPLPPVTGQELHVVAGGVQFDPAHNGLWDEQVLYATCAKLLNYPDQAGAAGAELRPEIAAAMPAVSPDGRTYTFRIRRGFRFSPPSGEPVNAETFRHTIEREVSTTASDSELEPYVADIVGVRAFYAGKARHISGITAQGNRLSIMLSKPAGDFLTRLAMPRFCPVPRSVPLRGGGDTPLPSAGPYYIASSLGDRSVLERNPNYPGDRPRRSARIVIQANVPEAKAIDLADRGSVDMIAASSAGELLSSGGVIDHRSRTSDALARQYRLYQGPIVDYFVFNTRRPLFRDLRLREAVGYALDRSRLAAAFGDTPADRIVPPAVPGYPAGRIFPLSPDLSAARKLAGGGPSRHATVYICGRDPRERTLAEIVRTDLAPIKIAISVLEDDQCPDNPRTAPKPSHSDLLLVSGWPWMESDERDPGRVLDQALASAAYGTPLPADGWDARSFRRQLGRDRPLRGAARVAAYRKLADEFTRKGPVAVFGSWVWSEYFSPQAGCRVFQGEYGIADLGALCRR